MLRAGRNLTEGLLLREALPGREWIARPCAQDPLPPPLSPAVSPSCRPNIPPSSESSEAKAGLLVPEVGSLGHQGFRSGYWTGMGRPGRCWGTWASLICLPTPWSRRRSAGLRAGRFLPSSMACSGQGHLGQVCDIFAHSWQDCRSGDRCEVGRAAPRAVSPQAHLFPSLSLSCLICKVETMLLTF